MTTPMPIQQRSWLRLIHDRNPFYLLSGLSMFVGCHLLSKELSFAGNLWHTIALLGVINLYEILLIALGLFLLLNTKLRRDGWILLTLEALFLVDILFLNGDIATASVRVGLFINLALAILAAGKIAVVLRVLRAPHARRVFAFILLQIMAILALPTLFRHIAGPRGGSLAPLVVYAAWWAAGLLAVLGAIVLPRSTPHAAGREPRLVRLFLGLPYASLLAHLYAAGWVYHVDFVAPCLAPVLLAGAMVLAIRRPRLLQAPQLAQVQLLLLIAGVLLSASFPASLRFATAGVVITPLRLALVGASIVGLHALWVHRDPLFVMVVVTGVGGAILGHCWHSILHNAGLVIAMVNAFCRRLVPSTTMEWGIAAVAASFALLGAGAAISLKKHKSAQPPPLPSGLSFDSTPDA